MLWFTPIESLIPWTTVSLAPAETSGQIITAGSWCMQCVFNVMINLQNHIFIIFQSTQFYWHSLHSHASIHSSSFLSKDVCWCVFSIALHRRWGTHIYSACHPLPARSLACSDSGNERQTAAHSSAHILHCWWHKNGQLIKRRKGKTISGMTKGQGDLKW